MDQGYMSPEDLMHAFFDGGIEPEQESALFAELGRNPELRSQFNEHQKIRSSLKYYGGQITAPAAATSQLFTRLGMTVPATAVPSSIPPAAGAAAASATWFNRRSLALYGITAISAVLVTLVTLISIGDDTGGALDSASSNLTSLTPARTLDADAQPETTQERVAGGLDSHGGQNSSASSSAHSSSFADNASSPAPSGATPSGLNNANSTASASTTAAANPAAAMLQAPALSNGSQSADAQPQIVQLNEGTLLAVVIPQASAPTGGAPASPSVSQFDPLAFPEVMLPDAKRFSLRINYIGGVSSPDVAANASVAALANSQYDQNLSIDLLYALNQDWSLGLTYGREQFGQVFRFRDPNNVLLEYRQNPIIDWLGLTARYSPEALTVAEIAKPYFEAQAGYGSTDAFLGRFSAGINARVFDLVELDMGWHYSELLYAHPDGRNTSFKSGLRIGASYAIY